MDLLERGSFLDELAGALATGGQVVLVAGEAGIGKSALVRAVHRAALGGRPVPGRGL
jgi:predicted ATPase